MRVDRWLVIWTVLTGIVFGSVESYQNIAEQFLSYKQSFKKIVSSDILDDNGTAVAYIFDLSDGGYILVPIDRAFSPIKAYSFKNNYETLPEPYKAFLIKSLHIKSGTPLLTTQSRSGKIASRWDFLENYQPSVGQMATTSYTPNSYLLTTNWDQGTPYNDKLPMISDGSGGEMRAWAGCVQTAMAQMMRYHQYPAHGRGVATHTWNSEAVKAILYKPYNWNNMPDILDGSTSEYMRDEVGYLMRDLAIVNESTLDSTGTASSVPTQEFFKYFGYSNAVSFLRRDSDNYSAFIDQMREEIDLLRPVLIGFPGHLAVADGYSDDDTGSYVHVNMGWGGHSNDFYNLDEAVDADYYTFNTDTLYMVHHIMPCSEADGDCYLNFEGSENLDTDQQRISGRFDSLNDSDTFDLYLKGAVTLGGTRGYSNQAFFITVYDADAHLIASSYNPISTTLPSGKYQVELSLCNSSGSCYTYNESYSNYTVDYTTEALSDEEKTQIDQSWDKAPIIDMEIPDQFITGEKRILINALDENGDEIKLSAFSNADLDLSFENNVLVLQPTVAEGVSQVIVEAVSTHQSVRKSFTVVIGTESIAWGKNFTVSGRFEAQNSFDKHPAILSGSCQISGYRGYSNQAFYTSVMDMSSSYIVPMNNVAINDTFPADQYLLGASLKQNPAGSGSYYTYNPDYADYTLTVSCPDSDLTMIEVADLLGIDLSESSHFKDSDGDGISDDIEGGIDTDDDGIANYLDTDSDNDGFSDQYEVEQGWDPLVPNLDRNEWTTVSLSDETADFSDIQAALDSGANKIMIQNGHYSLYRGLGVTRDHVEIAGESVDGVVIEPANSEVCIDLFYVGGDYVTVSDVTLRQNADCNFTAFVTSEHHDVTLQNSKIIGSDGMFAVYFAGPYHEMGQEPLDKVEAGELDFNNQVINNEINSSFDGDVLSFSLQKEGNISGNTLNGGLIALFLDRNVTCADNTLNHPNAQGIFLSLPSYDVMIQNNKIMNPMAAGITVKMQTDHRGTDGQPLLPESYRSIGMQIIGNHIENARSHAIEINNLKNSVIRDNTIEAPDFSGIYLYQSENLYIGHNHIINAAMVAAGQRTALYDWNTAWDSGIYLEQYITDCVVSLNTIESIDNTIPWGIAINHHWEGNEDNRIYWNHLLGDFVNEAVHVEPGTPNEQYENEMLERTGQDIWLQIVGNGKVIIDGVEYNRSTRLELSDLGTHTVEAVPSIGSTFIGWGEPLTCTGSRCTVENNTLIDLVARFDNTETYKTELSRTGWNLIAICQDINISHLNLTGIEEIQSQNGEIFYNNENRSISTLKTLEAGYGYWIKGTAGVRFEVSIATESLQKPLQRTGWNLMASCEERSRDLINMTDITEIQAQNGESIYVGEWVDYSNLDQLLNGIGYWVRGDSGVDFEAKR